MRNADQTTTTQESKHADGVRSAKRWGAATIGFVVVLVAAFSVVVWRLKVDSDVNGRQTDRLSLLFDNFERVQADLADSTRKQTTLDCQQTAGRNEGIKQSWHAFIDNFATPEQQQRPDVIKFLADLDTRFPPLTCAQSSDTPVVVPLPSTVPGQASLPPSSSVP